MKNKHLLFLLVATGLLCPLRPLLAASTITFEIVATFDYPNSYITFANGINDAGVVAGTVITLPNLDASGFLRYPTGRFSRPMNDPNDYQLSTYLWSINNNSVLGGWYVTNSLNTSGILLSGNVYTDFNIPGAYNTKIFGLNDAGNFCGVSDDIETNSAYVSIGGVVTTFNLTEIYGTTASGLNNLNQCVGSYASAKKYYGFFRDADGTFIAPILAQGNLSTQLLAINDKGSMVGNSSDRVGAHGLFFLNPNTSASFDYPGALSTFFTGINNRGLICGYYTTGSSYGHGFIVRVKTGSGN